MNNIFTEKNQQNHSQVILNAVSDGVTVIDKDLTIQYQKNVFDDDFTIIRVDFK